MNYYKTLLLVAILLLVQNLFSQEKPTYQTTKLANGIYELVADGGGYPVKVIASVGDDGLLIVDSGAEEDGEALVEVLKTFNKGMPKIIINTHSHIEHIGGNIAIGKGPTIIGHKNLRDRYINGLYVFNGIPDSALPNVTFTDSMSVFFNGEEIKLIAFPGAHDNSDIIVWFTNSKIVCTAALCNRHHFPSVDGELGDILKYPETVAKVISILPEDVRLVPGHGVDCTMKEFREFHDMLVKTSNIIRTELAKGKSLNELQEEDILADWKSWELYVDRNDWIQYWVKAIQKPKIVSTKMKIYAPIYHTVLQSGVDSAIALYNDLKTMHSGQYEFEERTAMWIGRRLAYIDRNDDAVKFLNLCIKEYPNTDAEAISQYSLGNIYWDSDNKKLAKEPYKKYLERFPRDETVRERIKELEKDK
jgi:cyclase